MIGCKRRDKKTTENHGSTEKGKTRFSNSGESQICPSRKQALQGHGSVGGSSGYDYTPCQVSLGSAHTHTCMMLSIYICFPGIMETKETALQGTIRIICAAIISNCIRTTMTSDHPKNRFVVEGTECVADMDLLGCSATTCRLCVQSFH